MALPTQNMHRPLPTGEELPQSVERVLADGALEIRIEAESEGLRVGLSGELDLANSGTLERVLVGLELVGAVQSIQLDLRRLEFIDSSGIHCVIRAVRRSETDGRALTVTARPGPVLRAFEVCGLKRDLPLLVA